MRTVQFVALLLVRLALVAAIVLVVKSVTMAGADTLISKPPGGALSFQHQAPSGEPYGDGLSRLMAALRAN